MPDDDSEEGEIDEAFWAREDDMEARRKLLWADAAPCVWRAAPAPPAGCVVVGDVRWPARGSTSASSEAAVAAEPAQDTEKHEAGKKRLGEEPEATAEPEKKKKKKKKEKKNKEKDTEAQVDSP